MGGFYGSIQVRTTDREGVRSTLEGLAGAWRRFLVGPPLNGWIGIYLDGNGQDFGIARDLARLLGGELVATLVHDDDVFAYEYHRDGRCIDRYDSAPDYHGEVSEAGRHDLRGDPSTFAHLAADPARFEAVARRMAAQDEDRDVFASRLLEEFAASLGIRNAVTSYEYLKDDEEAEDIEGWREFVHVPDLADEKARKRAAKAALAREKKRLMEGGFLLAEHGGRQGWAVPSPWWTPGREGFLVAWSSHADPQAGSSPVELHGPPWSRQPSATPWGVGPHVYGMELSPSGRYLAVAHAAGIWKAALWDLDEDRLVAEAPQVRAVTSVGFLPDESAMFSVSSHDGEGRIVLTPVGGGEARVIELAGAKLAAVHPSGAWIVVADERHRLLVLDLATARVERAHFVGGPKVLTELEQRLKAAYEAAMAAVDLDALEAKMRRQQEAMLTKSRQDKTATGISLEQLRAQFEAGIRQMRQGLGAGRFEQPERGTEIVFRLRFRPSGEQLFLATSGGVRVYAWSDVLSADDLRPTHAVGIPASLNPGDPEGVRREGFAYDLDHDPGRDRLLFGGLDGRVRFLDLASGRSVVLLEPPGLPPIHRLGLTRDRTALAVTASPGMFDRGSPRRGSTLQIWDYRRIGRG